MPKYYPINEEAARRAKNANSFSDYVPGSATAAYHEMVDRAYALGEQQKGRVDPMYHEKIDGLIDRYARKLESNVVQLTETRQQADRNVANLQQMYDRMSI